MRKVKEINLIDALKEKAKKEKLTYKGAFVVFERIDGVIGTATSVESPIWILRLLEEAKVQQKIIDKQRDIWAEEAFIERTQSDKSRKYAG
ncbi:MAG: hypothetical protein KJ674_01850 [Nanoarchaeota archaeon]|nr:hypothetical protein [Nanoarchaeota archaeon]